MTLLHAHSLYLAFLRRLVALGVLQGDARRQAESALDQHTSTTGSSSTLSPADARAATIARFKHERALERQIADLEAKYPLRLDLDDPGENVATPDEEIERRLWLARLHLAAARALGAIRSLEQELTVLRHMQREGLTGGEGEPDQPDRHGGQPSTSASASTFGQAKAPGHTTPGGPSGGPGEMLAKLSEIAGHLSLSVASAQATASRERTRAGVFRPSHLPPTMTLRELGDREVAEAVAREARQTEAAAARRARAEAVREGSDDEQELQRVRQMDDFKDEHKRGSGNSAIKPLR